MDVSKEFSKDPVNHPSHYNTGKYECIDVMIAALGTEVTKGFCLGNAFKYLYRCLRKNGLEDVKKAQWYINKFIELEESDNEEVTESSSTNPYEKGRTYAD